MSAGVKSTFVARQAGPVLFDGVSCEEKAALVLRGRSSRVEGIVFQNLRVPDANGAGIRLEDGDLVVRDSLFRNGENGILVANDHDGTIRVEPRGPGGGSRFVVTLPLQRVMTVVPNADPVPTDVAAVSQRILLVDDNFDACDMMRIALEETGHVVRVAGNGADALALADDFRPQIGVLDIGLPGMDGYELALRLRAKHVDIRLIALTGYGQIADLEAAAAAGFDAHCAKPVTIAGLLDEIEGRKAV